MEYSLLVKLLDCCFDFCPPLKVYMNSKNNNTADKSKSQSPLLATGFSLVKYYITSAIVAQASGLPTGVGPECRHNGGPFYSQSQHKTYLPIF
jgi:hypothetical protein